MTDLKSTLEAGYAIKGPSILLGAGMVGADLVTEPKVRLPLAMMNRHGLIAGATGTGKTKTLQLIAEQLSMQGVPVFVADLKGDLSGIAMPGEAGPRVTERATSVGYDWKPAGSPVEFVSLSGKLGVQLRATVSSFGPLLLAKVLELNETQESVLTLVFKFCDDQGLHLLDFKDLRSVLQFLTSDEGKPALAQYGGMASTTVGVLLRKMIELETQGAEQFFGEPEFDVRDLLHVGSDGRGVVTCLELADVQDKPRLFSTFMMWMLAELFQNLPEAGDLDKPKLCFFFDEAHLLFADASKAFLEQVQQVVRLIRSKGVGIYFITQSPKDVPDDVLGQLGNRVQHALRAHTPDEEAALRAAVRTFPKTELYDLQATLMSLGIGEAVITGLDGRGVPTPVVACRLIPPASRMAPLTPDELQADIRQSDFIKAYGQAVDRESAYEMLAARQKPAASGPVGKSAGGPSGPFGGAPQEPPPAKSSGKVGKGVGAVVGGAIAGALASRAGRALGTALVRGVFGMLTGRAPRGT
ncbi:MAG TPA: helicase HerA-like domain-containing protein, partial [Gemmatimonadales bacterium]